VTEPRYIRQVPRDFSPTIEVMRGCLVCRRTISATLAGRYVEYAVDIAVRFTGPKSVADLKREVWRVDECMRLGLVDMVQKHRRDRHGRRPGMGAPQVDAATLRQLHTPYDPHARTGALELAEWEAQTSTEQSG